MADKLTAILIGGTGATGKEVLKELNATELISKIIFISRRALEFPDQPKVRNLIKVLYRYRSSICISQRLISKFHIFH